MSGCYPAGIINRPDMVWAISGTCPTDRINCADTVCAMCVMYPATASIRQTLSAEFTFTISRWHSVSLLNIENGNERK